jgi:signal transduction histidine kinase
VTKPAEIWAEEVNEAIDNLSGDCPLASAEAIVWADSEIKRLTAEVKSLNNQLQWANAECKRARLDERQAMTYLSQVRIAAEHDGDFPSLVEHVKQMTEALRAAHEMAKAAWIEGSEAGWRAARGEDNDA